jgi:hypothetical protein
LFQFRRFGKSNEEASPIRDGGCSADCIALTVAIRDALPPHRITGEPRLLQAHAEVLRFRNQTSIGWLL